MWPEKYFFRNVYGSKFNIRVIHSWLNNEKITPAKQCARVPWMRAQLMRAYQLNMKSHTLNKTIAMRLTNNIKQNKYFVTRYEPRSNTLSDIGFRALLGAGPGPGNVVPW